jgi:hypothetical protein
VRVRTAKPRAGMLSAAVATQPDSNRSRSFSEIDRFLGGNINGNMEALANTGHHRLTVAGSLV